MAYPAPVSLGSATTLTFLLQAETGIVIGSFSRKTDSKKVEIYDASVGYTTGDIYHDFKADYDVKGRQNNTTGIAAAAPGVAVTLANTSTGNGVTTGLIITQNTNIDHSSENPREFSISAMQRPGITS